MVAALLMVSSATLEAGVPTLPTLLLALCAVSAALVMIVLFCASHTDDGDASDYSDDDVPRDELGLKKWVDVCATCGNRDEGEADPEEHVFYCNNCWADWEAEHDDESDVEDEDGKSGSEYSGQDDNSEVGDKGAAQAEAAPDFDADNVHLKRDYCEECHMLKMGEPDEFDTGFYCTDCWDQYELQDEQEMSPRTPNGNYLGRRKSNLAKARMKRGINAVRAAARMRLSFGRATGAKIPHLRVKSPARVYLKRAECLTCGETSLGEEDDVEGFFCNACWDEYEAEEESGMRPSKAAALKRAAEVSDALIAHGKSITAQDDEQDHGEGEEEVKSHPDAVEPDQVEPDHVQLDMEGSQHGADESLDGSAGYTAPDGPDSSGSESR